MTPAEKVSHNFWTQAEKLGIYDHSTGLSELLDLVIEDHAEDFADALERLGYTVTVESE